MSADCYAELEEYRRLNPWTAEDVAFWTGMPTYQPWKDVAAFFRAKDVAAFFQETSPDDEDGKIPV